MPDAERILHNTPLDPLQQHQQQHSQMPDAERILSGTPLAAEQHQDQQPEETFADEAYQGDGAAGEYEDEGYSRAQEDPGVDEQRHHLLEASLQHVVRPGVVTL